MNHSAVEHPLKLRIPPLARGELAEMEVRLDEAGDHDLTREIVGLRARRRLLSITRVKIHDEPDLDEERHQGHRSGTRTVDDSRVCQRQQGRACLLCRQRYRQ